MGWTMSSARDGPDVKFYIGTIKVAEIHMGKVGPRWNYCLKFFDGEPPVELFPSMSLAMKRMHVLLNSPPREVT